ncbi:VWA domain-containing protein [bacterium]|nr:VWA domain-containing protein [bacterium]
MFLDFFESLRKHGIKVTLREYLDLMEALKKEVAGPSIDEFYYLAKTILIKDESKLDLFDILFGRYFESKLGLDVEGFEDIPEDWIRNEYELNLSEEEKAMIDAMGGLDALIEQFRKIWEEQDERHEGGNKWIGSAGTSPYGANGFNPEGFRIGQKGSRNRKAIKVWDKREFANLDDGMELNTRNLKMALRRLRILTREGNPDELDLNKTIKRTSENAGMLDIQMVPTRKNRVKVLMMLDIGGSMDDHIRTCSELFSAAKYEFKHLEYYYFHNCLYDFVWKDNYRRHSDRISTWELLHTYNRDYKVIWIGDAAMSPVEIMYAGGSVEHWNEEPGMIWLQRMKDHFPNMAWINPTPKRYWNSYESSKILKEFMEERMYPMTLHGIGDAMKELKKT